MRSGEYTASKIADSFNTLSSAQQMAVLSSGALDIKQKEMLATSAGLTITETGQVVATESLAGAQTTATATTSGFSAAMTGLGASLKTVFISLATNPFTYLVAGLTVGVIALHKYITAFDDAVNKAQESQSEYSKTACPHSVHFKSAISFSLFLYFFNNNCCTISRHSYYII